MCFLMSSTIWRTWMADFRMFKVTLDLKSKSTFDLLTRPSQKSTSETKSRKIESISVLLLESKNVFVVIVVVKWNQVQTLTLFENQFYALGINDFEFHEKMTTEKKQFVHKAEEKQQQQQTCTH